jgi:hypothetical protein
VKGAWGRFAAKVDSYSASALPPCGATAALGGLLSLIAQFQQAAGLCHRL